MNQCLEAVKSGQVGANAITGGGPASTGDKMSDWYLSKRARAEHADFLRLLTAHVEAMKVPVPEQAAKLKELEPRRLQAGVLARMLLLGTDKIQGALARNLPITVVNHATGPHAFDVFDDSPASREVVRQSLAFLQFHLAG